MNGSFRGMMRQPRFRYLFIGGSVYLLELALILIAQAAGATPVWAVAISYITGTLVSFFLQKLVTFNDSRMHHKIVVSQLVATVGLFAFNFGFTLLLTKLISPPVPAVVARTLALAITVIWNFYIYKTKIFNKTEKLIY